MTRPWVQPTLGGASVKSFRLVGRFHWPTGWLCYLEVQMEGDVDATTVVQIAEAQTPEMMAAVANAMELLRALLLGDD